MGHHPLHGPGCLTRTFPIRCRDCRASVFLFTCTCGSGALFEDLGWPWPPHDCETRALRETAAREREHLRRARDPAAGRFSPFADLKSHIDPSHLAPDVAAELETYEAELANGPTPRPEHVIKHMEPVADGEEAFFIGVVRERAQATGQIDAVYTSVGDLGRRALNLPAHSAVLQLTIVETQDKPNESYTGLVDRGLTDKSIAPGTMVGVCLTGRVRGSVPFWLITHIEAL